MLRADASGWPFTGEVTWFTASLVLFPVLVAGILLLRGWPWVRVGLAAALPPRRSSLSLRTGER